ncbi:hypothetical protein Tco_1363230 [Tanacetum coccineum]
MPLPGLEYPEYVAPSNDEIPVEDPEEDLTDYPADGGDDNDDDDEEEESFKDDDDNEEEEEAIEKDGDEEEEHLALADSTTVTPPQPPRSPQTRVPFSQTRLRRIPSLPLPVSSLTLPLPSPPTYIIPTYDRAPLGYRAAMIQLRAASPSTHHLLLPSEIPPPPFLLPYTAHKDDILETDMPLQKRAHFTAPTSRFEIRESSTTATSRLTGRTLTHRVDYGFIDTMDASIWASKGIAMNAIGEVNERVTDLATNQRQDAQELYVHCEDAQDDRDLLRS